MSGALEIDKPAPAALQSVVSFQLVNKPRKMPAPFEKFVKIANFFYTSVGIRPYHDSIRDSGDRKSLLLNIVFYFSAVNLNLHLLGEFLFVFMAFHTGTDFVDAIVTASYIGYVTVADCKMIFVWYQKNELTKLINDLREIYPTTTEKQAAYKLKSYLRHMTTVMLLFASLYMMQIWTFNLFPIMQYAIYQFMGKDIEQSLPYNVYLPLNWRNSVWYFVLNGSQIIGGYTAAAGIISSDLLLCGIVTQVCMHYDYIKGQIEDYTPQGDKESMDFLKRIVVYHQKVLSLSDGLNTTFGMPLLFNFAVSSFIICFIGFSMSTGIANEDLFKYILLLLASLVQVYLISYYGERITTSSLNIAVAVYNQNWYTNASNSYKKTLIIMMNRAQKPAQLQATVFLTISLATFTDIGQLSYKFFALLRTMYLKK